jgi:hypothetical protein
MTPTVLRLARTFEEEARVSTEDEERKGERKTNIKKSSLSGSRRSHEGGELARTDVTEDVVKELTLSSRNGNGVAGSKEERVNSNA